MPPPDATTVLGGVPSRVRVWGGSARDRAVRRALLAAARPLVALGTLVAIQWLALLAFALTVRHNGIVFYQGGDQIGLTTDAWLLAHGHLPPTVLGFGWPFVLLPFGWLSASDYVAFMPYVIGLNVLVLGPIALACVYGLAARIGGRLLGLWAAALWVAAPYLAIPFFREDYHARFVEQFLPQALGLSGLADYPSMVCLLVAAWLAARALDTAQASWAVLAGLAAGFGVAIKPSNVLFLAGPALLVLLARRWRAIVPYGFGLAAPVLLLTLWKLRGLGTLPVFALEETRIAAGATVAAIDGNRYVDLDWAQLRQSMANLREFFWSARVLQWLPLAGAFAVARRSLPAAGLFGGWFSAFLVIKGTSLQASVETGSFFRLLMPAYPAYFLLAAATPLLVPGLARRVPARFLPAPPRVLGPRVLAAAAVVFVVLPLVAVAAPRPLSRERPRAITLNSILTPVDSGIEVGVTADGAKRTLTWTHRDFGATSVFYRVFRTAAGGKDVDCLADGSPDCRLQMLPLGTTRTRSFTDLSPPEDALYRVGVATNWQDDAGGGDVVAISKPIPATP